MSKYKVGKGKHLVDMMFTESLNDKRNDSHHQRVWRKVKTSLCDLEGYVPLQKQTRQDYQWPEYKTESQRIRINSNKVRNLSITDAFSKLLGVTINGSDVANITPVDLHAGDIVKMTARMSGLGDVEFDSVNLKQEVTSCIRLGKYSNFKRFTGTCPVDVKVVSVNNRHVVIDPVAPMLDRYILPFVEEPFLQKRLDHGVRPVTVKNLKLTRGGYLGQAVIPNVSSWCGEEYTVDAFIPGSQIVLNIEDNFEKWNGKTVSAFITNYVPKTTPDGKTKMSLICSVKELLKFEGEKMLIEAFKMWCDDDTKWKEFSEKKLVGDVTGVIHTSKKCGVFVEIPDLHITGFVSTPQDKIVNYKPHDKVIVNWVGIEENTKYDEATKQSVHNVPFVIEDGVLQKCYIKPVFKFVENPAD